MKARTIWMMTLLPVGLAAALAVPQDGGADGALKQRISELEGRVELLEAYLQSQALASKATAVALEKSRSAGFTSGINPLSREILLDAWKLEISAKQRGLPGQTREADEDAEK